MFRKWATKANEQADDFVGVCAADPQVPAEKDKGSRDRLDGEETGNDERFTLAAVQLAVYLIAVSVVFPVCFFICLLPLFWRSVPMEVHQGYYWMMFYASASLFGRKLAHSCLGEACSLCLMVFFQVILAVAQQLLYFVPCTGKVISRNVLLFASLMFPGLAVYRKVQLRQRQWFRKTMAWALLMFYGASPIVLCSGLDILLFRFKWAYDQALLSLALAIWTFSPFVIKYPGVFVTKLACSDTNPFFAPLMFAIYSDTVFGSLGLLTFVQTTTATLSFSVTLIPAFCLLGVRGLKCVHRLTGDGLSLRNRRLAVFLECLSSTVGRLTAYSFYFCSKVMTLLDGTGGERRHGLNLDIQNASNASADSLMTFRRNLLPDSQNRTTVSANIIFHSADGSADVLATVAGFFLTMILFFTACALMAHFWKAAKTSVVSPEDDDQEQEGVRDVTQCRSTFGKRHSAVAASFEEVLTLLLAFLRRSRADILCTSAFVMMVCSATKSLAETMIWKLEQADCSS